MLYIFRINAIFAPGRLAHRVNLETADSPAHPGSSVWVVDQDYYDGDTVTIQINLAPGAALGTWQGRNCPVVSYTNAESVTAYLDAQAGEDGTYTFTVPGDALSSAPNIHVFTVFEDAVYAVHLPEGMDEIIGTVTEVVPPVEAEIVEAAFSNGALWRTTESQTLYLGHKRNCMVRDAAGKAALPRDGGNVTATDVRFTGTREKVYDIFVGGEDDENVFFVAGIAAEGYFTKKERGLS